MGELMSRLNERLLLCYYVSPDKLTPESMDKNTLSYCTYTMSLTFAINILYLPAEVHTLAWWSTPSMTRIKTEYTALVSLKTATVKEGNLFVSWKIIMHHFIVDTGTRDGHLWQNYFENHWPFYEYWFSTCTSVFFFFLCFLESSFVYSVLF